MQASEIMPHNVECIHPDASVRDAARRMKALDVGALPICGDDDRLAGILSDRDITIRVVAAGSDPQTTKVREAMTPGVVYCFDDQDVIEAAELMEDKQVRRLVVLNRAKRLVGIVSLGDLAVRSGDEQLAGETIEAISEPLHV